MLDPILETVDALSGLDFEPDIPCTRFDCDGRQADYFEFWSCGCVYERCDEHHTHNVEESLNGVDFECSTCGWFPVHLIRSERICR